jgi:hypothetical protein
MGKKQKICSDIGAGISQSLRSPKHFPHILGRIGSQIPGKFCSPLSRTIMQFSNSQFRKDFSSISIFWFENLAFLYLV